MTLLLPETACAIAAQLFVFGLLSFILATLQLTLQEI